AILAWSPNTAGLPLLPDSDWAFVALVVQPSQAAIYVCSNTAFASFTGVTNLPPAGHGKLPFADPTLFGLNTRSGAALNGALDEVAVFNRALSVGEVYSQYAAGVGGVPPRVFSDPQIPNPLYTGDALALTVDAGGTPNLS